MSCCKSDMVYPSLAYHITPGCVLTGIYRASVSRAFLMPHKMTHWKNTKSERVEQGRNCIPESGCLCHLALGMSRKIFRVTCCTLPTLVSCTTQSHWHYSLQAFPLSGWTLESWGKVYQQSLGLTIVQMVVGTAWWELDTEAGQHPWCCDISLS